MQSSKPKSSTGASDLLTTHYNRVCRVVEESLDVAFNVCNSDLHYYTASKIFDVFDQIFLTAFILNTGYWVYFVTTHGSCLCVCGRFGVPCRHIRNANHWIDLQPINDPNGELIFFPKTHGPVRPLDYKVNVECINDPIGYSINIHMNLVHDKIMNKKFQLNVSASYAYTCQNYDPHYTVMFSPSPFYIDFYGMYLEELKRYKQNLKLRNEEERKKYMVVTIPDMPQSSLILVNVNVSRYVTPSKMSAVLLPNYETQEIIKREFRDQETQTDCCDQLDLEITNYKKLVEQTASNIWKCEDLNDSKNYPILSTFLAKTPEDCNFPTGATTSYPIVIEDSEEYDVQFPNMNLNKVVRKMPHYDIKTNPETYSSFNYDPYLNSPVGEVALPNFGQSFNVPGEISPTVQSAPPTPTAVARPRRKRGRPKIDRGERIPTYSEVARSRKPRGGKVFSPPSSSCEVFRNVPVSPSYSDVVKSTSRVNTFMNDPNFEILNNVFKASAARRRTMTPEDIDFELSIIDEYIREEAEKEAMIQNQANMHWWEGE